MNELYHLKVKICKKSWGRIRNDYSGSDRTNKLWIWIYNTGTAAQKIPFRLQI
jgi:hypothetical protein